MRLEGPSETIRNAYPAEYADLAVVVTDLGGTTVLMMLVALSFWLGRRRQSALLASHAVAGLGLILLLKALFAMPRPPEEVFLVSMDDDPYGFPSGHAFAAVIVYGGLLVAYDRVRDPAAVAGVASVVVLISLSRVVLGFHYLGDVIVGAALGVAFLAVMFSTVTEPRVGFTVGLLLAMLALVVTGGVEETLLGVGAAVGGLIGTWRLKPLASPRSRFEGGFLAVTGLFFLVGVRTIESWIGVHDVATVVVYAMLVAGIFLLPTALDRIDFARVGGRTA